MLVLSKIELDALEADMGTETESSGVPSYLQPDKEPDLDAELTLPAAPTGVPPNRQNPQVYIISCLMLEKKIFTCNTPSLSIRLYTTSGRSNLIYGLQKLDFVHVCSRSYNNPLKTFLNRELTSHMN